MIAGDPLRACFFWTRPFRCWFKLPSVVSFPFLGRGWTLQSGLSRGVGMVASLVFGEGGGVNRNRAALRDIGTFSGFVPLFHRSEENGQDTLTLEALPFLVAIEEPFEKDSPDSSLPEFMSFNLFGKTILVGNIKFELFLGHPLSQRDSPW